MGSSFSRSGVEAESFESWYSWFVSFLPQDSRFLQDFSSRFMIHEDYWSPGLDHFLIRVFCWAFLSLVIHDSKIHDSYMFCNYDSWFRIHPRFRYKTRQDDLLNSALICPGFLFSKNWIPDFNHYLDSTTRLRSCGNCKGDLATWSRKKTTGRMSLLLSISAGFRIPKPWILGDKQ